MFPILRSLAKVCFSPKALFLSLLSLIAYSPVTLFAAEASGTDPDVATMMANFAQTVPNFMKLVTGVAYVMGMYLIVKGVVGLKQFGEQRSMMSANHEMKGSVIMLVVGTALLYLPSSVTAGFNTFWTDSSALAYIPSKGSDQFSIIYQDGYLIIQLIGTIAFIRGLLTLNHLGGQSAQPGTFGKAMAFIISGILCINFYSFMEAMSATLGITLG